jgi:ParB family transcriptional regulator, chromosome partitioning protein
MSAVRRELRVDDPLAAAERSAAASGEYDDASVAGGLRVIPVDVIDANPNQPRRRFDESALTAFADSIRERGVLQPIILRPLGDRYQLVAGERRWRAAQLAGLPAIPALVDDAVDDSGSLEVALIENLVREGPQRDRGGSHVRGPARGPPHNSGRARSEGRSQSRGYRQHGPAPRSARRGDRAG